MSLILCFFFLSLLNLFAWRTTDGIWFVNWDYCNCNVVLVSVVKNIWFRFRTFFSREMVTKNVEVFPMVGKQFFMFTTRFFQGRSIESRRKFNKVSIGRVYLVYILSLNTIADKNPVWWLSIFFPELLGCVLSLRTVMSTMAIFRVGSPKVYFFGPNVCGIPKNMVLLPISKNWSHSLWI